jgi:ABC-type multidrug transport system fused ATPase/permease subunit
MALTRVSMDDKVRNSWPNGLETEILSQGENLSAGERQLLCLARALLCRARILLVDEGMSSVDAHTDSIAHDALLNLKGCTVLSICHNLGSLCRFDYVVVMDAGKVVEYGVPNDLLTSNDGSGKILQELVRRG